TFLRRLTKDTAALTGISALLNTQMSFSVALSKAATIGFTGMSATLHAAAAGAVTLAKGLAIALVSLGSILVVIGAVIGALYLLGKAFGIKIKLPTLETPDFGDLGFDGAETPEITSDDLLAGTEELSEAEK